MNSATDTVSQAPFQGAHNFCASARARARRGRRELGSNFMCARRARDTPRVCARHPAKVPWEGFGCPSHSLCGAWPPRASHSHIRCGDPRVPAPAVGFKVRRKPAPLRQGLGAAASGFAGGLSICAWPRAGTCSTLGLSHAAGMPRLSSSDRRSPFSRVLRTRVNRRCPARHPVALRAVY